jgi:hypothetical protein
MLNFAKIKRSRTGFNRHLEESSCSWKKNLTSFRDFNLEQLLIFIAVRSLRKTLLYRKCHLESAVRTKLFQLFNYFRSSE